MSHPTNKHERFLVGKREGERRASVYWYESSIGTYEERLEFVQRSSQRRRNTTKLCSCSMCGNPRRVAWKDKLTMQEKRFNESLKNL